MQISHFNRCVWGCVIFLLLCMGTTVFLQAQEALTRREVLSLDKGWRFHLGDIPRPVIKGHNETYRSTKAGGVRGAAAPVYMILRGGRSICPTTGQSKAG